MQTAITGAFPISFIVTDLWRRSKRCISLSLFSLRKFLMQTAITGAFPISFIVADLWRRSKRC